MTYSIDKKAQKTAYKKHIAEHIKDYGNFVKFSYYAEKFCYILMVVLGCWNIWHVVDEKEPLFLLFLIMTIGFPYGISLIFREIYKDWVLKKYKFRYNERLTLKKDLLQYTYDDYIKGVTYVYTAYSQNISNIEYNPDGCEIFVLGNIKLETMIQGEVIEENIIPSVDFLNIFQKDFIVWVKENNMTVAEK